MNLAQMEKRREADREYMRRRLSTVEGRAAHAASYKRYCTKNPEKVKAHQQKWRRENPDYWFKWRTENLKTWIVKSAKSRAAEKGLPFSLTVNDIAIPKVCPALGIVLDVSARRTAPNSIALDRIVPELGYVPTNVRVISRRANMIKNNATAGELESIAAYIRRETR